MKRIIEENELKPCPFCGGDAELKEGTVYLDSCFYVKCNTCSCRTPFVLIDHPCLNADIPCGVDETTRYTKEQAQQKAIEAWNRRSDNEN